MDYIGPIVSLNEKYKILIITLKVELYIVNRYMFICIYIYIYIYVFNGIHIYMCVYMYKCIHSGNAAR